MLLEKQAMMGSRQSQVVPFVRVLHPIDPWLDPQYSVERPKHFRGEYGFTSVAMTAYCGELLVLASFHGARREVGPPNPAVFRFTRAEALEVGGIIRDTDANPPWPPEYNQAHHDIVAGQDQVAEAMATCYENDPRRMAIHNEVDLLVVIALLLERADVNERFRKHAIWRLRRMFEENQQIWIQVAKQVPSILADEQIRRAFRRLWSENRIEWQSFAEELPQLTEGNGFRAG